MHSTVTARGQYYLKSQDGANIWIEKIDPGALMLVNETGDVEIAFKAISSCSTRTYYLLQNHRIHCRRLACTGGRCVLAK